MRPTPLALLLLTLCACAGPDPVVDAPPEGLTLAELASIARGRVLFKDEDFDGNGRTCSTCHFSEPGDNFDFTPMDAQQILATNPGHPLLRPIDAECGTGSDYMTLTGKALVRIPFVLPSNVTVDEPDGCNVRHDFPLAGLTTVWTLRSTPSIENIALEENIMWDGREGADLAHQAGSAVETHNQPGRLPTAREKEDMAAFQRTRFSNLALRLYAAGGPPPALPTVPSWLHGAHWDRVRAGKRFFETRPIVASADPALRGGICATCHSGPMLDTTNGHNPVSPAGLQTNNNNTTSEVNAAALPALHYRVELQHDVFMPAGVPPLPFFPPAGALLFEASTPEHPVVFSIPSPDPGSVLTTGDPCPEGAEVFCFISTFLVGGGVPTSQSFFRNSSLWGVADSAPYFHDNSCPDLECVLDHYQNNILIPTAAATGNPGWLMSAAERQATIEYMEFAFIRTTPL